MFDLIYKIGTCPSTDFTCTKSDGCTLKKNRCNTINDCADASDESADGDCSKCTYIKNFS